ncbi:universal stress protein [Streptomyces sp. KL116D]|uniref:universal stress protein n=1 Tax=Streptomyces sp. KL116D TaxID=3045152 RepID=UPI0035561ABF
MHRESPTVVCTGILSRSKRSQVCRADGDTHMKGQQENVGRIVAGVDGSPASVLSLRWALRQAEMTGAVVEAVTAWDIPRSRVRSAGSHRRAATRKRWRAGHAKISKRLSRKP